jgi:hypothetical protein
MNASFPLPLGIMLLSAVWMVVTMIRIQEYLRARGRRVNPLLLRIMIFDYIAEYRRITILTQGRPGVLYRQFIAAATLMSASAVVLAIAQGQA